MSANSYVCIEIRHLNRLWLSGLRKVKCLGLTSSWEETFDLKTQKYDMRKNVQHEKRRPVWGKELPSLTETWNTCCVKIACYWKINPLLAITWLLTLEKRSSHPTPFSKKYNGTPTLQVYRACIWKSWPGPTLYMRSRKISNSLYM